MPCQSRLGVAHCVQALGHYCHHLTSHGGVLDGYLVKELQEHGGCSKAGGAAVKVQVPQCQLDEVESPDGGRRHVHGVAVCLYSLHRVAGHAAGLLDGLPCRFNIAGVYPPRIVYPCHRQCQEVSMHGVRVRLEGAARIKKRGGESLQQARVAEGLRGWEVMANVQLMEAVDGGMTCTGGGGPREACNSAFAEQLPHQHCNPVMVRADLPAHKHRLHTPDKGAVLLGGYGLQLL
mmetsp:Transcript_32653/g.92606  ORF Transcript_32653/g.92606 Transcript_32653/m.92606 type:complete len:234 (+) Transcript_32653:139-840(+)